MHLEVLEIQIDQAYFGYYYNHLHHSTLRIVCDCDSCVPGSGYCFRLNCRNKNTLEALLLTDILLHWLAACDVIMHSLEA